MNQNQKEETAKHIREAALKVFGGLHLDPESYKPQPTDAHLLMINNQHHLFGKESHRGS